MKIFTDSKKYIKKLSYCCETNIFSQKNFKQKQNNIMNAGFKSDQIIHVSENWTPYNHQIFFMFLFYFIGYRTQ